jgi:hypothetical protein
VSTKRHGLAVAAVLFAVAAHAPVSYAGSRTYDVPGTYTYVVPATVTSLDVSSVGGNGADSAAPCLVALGGKGRVVTQTLAVTPGEVLQITVAGAGFRPGTGTFVPGGGGFGGGGNAITCTSGGGGASDVRRTPFAAADRVVVAGGGGGAGSGGAGGNAGSNGSDSGGATPGNGGAAGAAGVGGTGGPPSNACCSGGTNGTATNGGNAGTGNSSGGGGGGGFGGGGGGSGGLNTGANGGGGGGGGGSLGTPTGFSASASGNGSVTITHGATTLEVLKSLSPTSDPGRFDLKINGTTFKAGAANGDTTQQQVVLPSPASNAVGETGVTGTFLPAFDSAIACSSGDSATGPGPLNVNVGAGQSVLCTITNTRGAGTLTVVKALEPSSDPGRFDLQIDGVTKRAGAGNGDGTGPIAVTAGIRTVGEAAVAPTNAARYTTGVECRNGGGTVVAAGSTTGPLDVPVASGAAITCTIRNVIRPRVTVVKRLVPADDAGRFDLNVGATLVRAGAGDGQNGTVEVGYGSNVTVSETAAAGTDASKYDSAIDCGSGSTAGTERTLTNVTADITCVVTNTRRSEPPLLTLTGLTIEPKVFPAGAATARFALSRPALVVLRIDRVLIGKLRRGRCTVTGAARKTGPRCVRYDPAGRTTTLAGAGATRFPLDTRSLGTGRYRLRASAVDGSEQTPQLSVRFRIT